jgi:hypothetical protein
VRRAVAREACRAVNRARALAAVLVLTGCNTGPLEIAGADYPDAALNSLAENGVAPQIDPKLLPAGAPDHGIYLYWLFDSDSITASVDASGHQRDGQYLNLPTLSEAAPTTRAGDQRGLFFNGTGQAVVYSPDVALSALTFGLWLKPACLGACRVFSLAGGAGQASLTLDIGAAGRFELGAGASTQLDAGEACAACAVGVTPVIGEHWYHVAGSVDATGQARLFVDGKLDASGTGAVPRSATRLMLGSDSSAAPGFRGVLDEAIVYDWALPAADVAHLAAAATP